MPYHPIDHDPGMCSVLSRYTHFWCFVNLMHLLILSVLISQCLLAHLSTKIPFCGNVPHCGHMLDASASSGHPSLTSFNPLAMASPSNEGSTFTPPLPPPRAVPICKYCCSNTTYVHHHHHFCLHSYVLCSIRCPS